MGQLQKIESKLHDLGYRLLAISPDRPEQLKESAAKHGLGYRLLSDSKMAAARAFGVAFRVDDELFARYKQFGIDLEGASGEKHHLLPVPGVFVVGTDATIKFTHVDPDYKVRLDPEVLLAAAEAALD